MTDKTEAKATQLNLPADDASKPLQTRIADSAPRDSTDAAEAEAKHVNPPVAETGKPSETPVATSDPRESSETPFVDAFEFLDAVNGAIALNRLEVDAVDTPEFQRLFRLSQLGFVDFVYPTANHTRGAHSIGACFWAKKLVDTLNQNNAKARRQPDSSQIPVITGAERTLISLAALLHDLPHGPFSHDIEKKKHYVYRNRRADKAEEPVPVRSHYGLYPKHDDFAENPALYVFLMDVNQSVLARVLRHYSTRFVEDLIASEEKSSHLKRFVDELRPLARDEAAVKELLPQLLLHLLVIEKPEDAKASFITRVSFEDQGKVVESGIGPKANWAALFDSWYQPFRHDIVGNTLSADLMDYLLRDQNRLGMKNTLDVKLLDYYILAPWRAERPRHSSPEPAHANDTVARYRCAIDLNDHKRGTFRAERLNDIFRLLDLRHQIHEKAVHHRVVQSAAAMLSRAGLIQGKPNLAELYGFGVGSPAMSGDDRFLLSLIQKHSQGSNGAAHHSLPCKLAERRVYRPLMVIPGDRIAVLLRDLGPFESELEHTLRELAAIVDSSFFAQFFLLASSYIEEFLRHIFEDENEIDEDIKRLLSNTDRMTRVINLPPKGVIFWTTPYKQLYKDPALLICVNDTVTGTIDRLKDDSRVPAALRNRLDAGIRDAETKNEGLWKLYLFLSDGLFFTGLLAKLRDNHPCANRDNHKAHLETAQGIAVRSLRSAWQYWLSHRESIDLDSRALLDDLKDLLALFISEGVKFKVCREQDLVRQVSTVKVDQYLHGDERQNCRDVRYRFDSKASGDRVAEIFKGRPDVDSNTAKLVEDVIKKGVGIKVDSLTSEELSELVEVLLAAKNLGGLVQDRAARGKPIDDTKWKQAFRGNRG